jgi:hypothetical protein
MDAAAAIIPQAAYDLKQVSKESAAVVLLHNKSQPRTVPYWIQSLSSPVGSNLGCSEVQGIRDFFEFCDRIAQPQESVMLITKMSDANSC